MTSKMGRESWLNNPNMFQKTYSPGVEVRERGIGVSRVRGVWRGSHCGQEFGV